MEQKLHHVILGEQLGDRRQFIGADLPAGSVDLLLPSGLPELIGPAQRIVGPEYFRRQRIQQPAQLHLIVQRQRQFQHRIVLAEHAGQGLTGETAGQLEAITRAQFRRQFLAILQGDGYGTVSRIGNQQMVLGQEAGEQQPVPMLVSGVGGQMVDLLERPDVDRACRPTPGHERAADCAITAARRSCVAGNPSHERPDSPARRERRIRPGRGRPG